VGIDGSRLEISSPVAQTERRVRKSAQETRCVVGCREAEKEKKEDRVLSERTKQNNRTLALGHGEYHGPKTTSETFAAIHCIFFSLACCSAAWLHGMVCEILRMHS
jgi:hypothetical protein